MIEKNKNEKYKILIIDDQKTIHEDFEKILILYSSSSSKSVNFFCQLFDKNYENNENLGYDFLIDFAFQGEEGFKIIQKANEQNSPYQVVFVDMRMPPGWDGLKTIKECGGLTIVQDPTTAEADSMPKAAIEATTVDYVLPLQEIGSLLNTIVGGTHGRIGKSNHSAR